MVSEKKQTRNIKESKQCDNKVKTKITKLKLQLKTENREGKIKCAVLHT